MFRECICGRGPKTLYTRKVDDKLIQLLCVVCDGVIAVWDDEKIYPKYFINDKELEELK